MSIIQFASHICTSFHNLRLSQFRHGKSGKLGKSELALSDEFCPWCKRRVKGSGLAGIHVIHRAFTEASGDARKRVCRQLQGLQRRMEASLGGCDGKGL